MSDKNRKQYDPNLYEPVDETLPYDPNLYEPVDETQAIGINGYYLFDGNNAKKQQAWSILLAKDSNPFSVGGKIIRRGMVQGATMGLADEASATGAGLLSAVRNHDQPFFAFRKGYTSDKAESTALNKLSETALPSGYYGGMALGATATALIPGVGPGKGATALNAATKTKLAGTLKEVFKGAVQGGVSGFGFSDADIMSGEIPKAAVDTVIGTAIGGAFPLLTTTLVKAAAKSKDGLKKLQVAFAPKAAIGEQARFMEPLERSPVKKEEMAKILLDEGIMKGAPRAEVIKKRSIAAADNAGRELGKLLESVENTMPESVNSKAIADEIANYAATKEAPNNKALLENLLNQASEFEKKGKISLAEAQRLKKNYKYNPKEPASLSLGQEATNKIYMIIAKEMDKTVDDIGKLTMTPEVENVVNRYRELRSKYSALITAAQASTKLAAREAKNRTFSLTDYISAAGMLGGVAGAATDNPEIAVPSTIAAAVFNKAARQRGPALIAQSARNIDKSIDFVTKGMANSRWGSVLLNAAKKGNNNLALTHLTLTQVDPKYREHVFSLFSDSMDRKSSGLSDVLEKK